MLPASSIRYRSESGVVDRALLSRGERPGKAHPRAQRMCRQLDRPNVRAEWPAIERWWRGNIHLICRVIHGLSVFLRLEYVCNSALLEPRLAVERPVGPKGLLR